MNPTLPVQKRELWGYAPQVTKQADDEVIFRSVTFGIPN